MQKANVTQKSNWLATTAQVIMQTGIFATNICLALMLVITIVDVILRYVVQAPLQWGDTLMQYLMVMMVYLGIGFVLFEGGHIRMTALTDRLAPKAQRAMFVVSSLVGVAYMVLLVWGGTVKAQMSFESHPYDRTTSWPLFPFQAIIVVGLVIALIASIYFAIKKIRIARGIGTENTKLEELDSKAVNE
jgi:TRAP-type C4-dicarboxylate transport system permease small subunit